MYIGRLVELVLDVLFDDAGLADTLVAQQHDLEFGLAGHRCADRPAHFDRLI